MAYTNSSCTILDESDQEGKDDITEDTINVDTIMQTLFKGSLFQGNSALEKGQKVIIKQIIIKKLLSS